jgi:hypothetical protein
MNIRRLIWPVMIALIAGCGKSGPQLAPVSGRITLDGQPIENTDIAFYPEIGNPSAGRTDKDGHYELGFKRGMMGGMVGKNLVRISTSSELVKGPNRFPEKYNSKSELHRDVEPGKNVFDFDLKSEGK